MITGKSITFKSGKRILLENVDFSLEPGEIVGVIGKNGAGKSTLLKILTGQNEKYEGVVLYEGIEIKEFSNNGLAKIRSVLSQELNLPFDFSVMDILLMGRFPYLPLKKEDYDIIDYLIEEFELRDVLNTPYQFLSGGEKRRIQFAKTLAQIMPFSPGKSKYIFLDEPLAGLDLGYQKMVLNFLKKLCATYNLGVFIILHDFNFASQYCDNIYVLDQGRLSWQGNPHQVFTTENIWKFFEIEATILIREGSTFPTIIFD